MSEEVTTTAANGKKKPEVTKVTMKDGREVEFAGRRNLNKSFEITPEGVRATFDFRNGDAHSILVSKDDPLILQLAGHGLVQKGGDEAAGIKIEGSNEPDVDSMSLAVEDILKRLSNTEASVKDRWFTERAAGDGFSGASIVLKAIMEATGKDLEFVKSYIDRLLEKGKGDNPPLTRQKVYQSFRKPGSKTAAIIERLEKERAAGAPAAVDADAALAEMAGA